MYGKGMLKGLWVTLRHFWGAMFSDARKLRRRLSGDNNGAEPASDRFAPPTLTGIFTVQYPEQKLSMVKRFRGPLMHLRNPETQQARCTACGICIRACPSGCLSLEAEGKGKDRKPKWYTYDVGNCIFCRQCVESCPFDAIEMSHDYEVASCDKDTLWSLERMLELGDEQRDEISEKDQHWS
jgi:NADH-quinone oxidoreductase subunit I